jgi:hypothetical protein
MLGSLKNWDAEPDTFVRPVHGNVNVTHSLVEYK